MNSADFLDLLRAKKALTSDRKVAEYMGLNHGHVSNFRTGKREFPEALAVRIARELELPETYVLAELKANGAKDSTVKVIWENLAATIKKAHVVAIIAIIGLGGMPNEAYAAPIVGGQEYTLCAYLRKWLAWLRDLLRLSDDALPHGLYSLAGLTVIALAFLSISGCVTSYQHLSDPRIENDGYDLLCGGFEHDVGQVRLRADVCKNVAPNGGEFFHAAIEYRWRK